MHRNYRATKLESWSSVRDTEWGSCVEKKGSTRDGNKSLKLSAFYKIKGIIERDSAWVSRYFRIGVKIGE